jgi:ribosomal protein L15E
VVGDYKREVICIHFSHPTKKNELELAWEHMGSSPGREGRGKEEGERGRGLGCSWGAMGRDCYGGGQPAIYLFVCVAALC